MVYVVLPQAMHTGGIEAHGGSWRCKAYSLVMDGSRRVRLLEHFRRTLGKSMSHDVFTVAKAAAYSAMLTLFPALLVITTLLALTPETDNLATEIRSVFNQVLPSDTMNLAQIYFVTRHAHSLQVLWSASLVALFAAMGVMLSLMEGFRRAYRLPRRIWNPLRRRWTATALIPISLVPMIFATAILVFGHQIEHWMIDNADHELQFYVLLLWRMARWTVSVATGVAVLTVIYHFGIPRTHSWRRCVPGAILATLIWFVATLAYGWYVTRFAVYMAVYGSLAAVIATLVWLYITCLSILIGAEFNAQIFPKPELKRPASREAGAFTRNS
jgi:membrane protein